MVAKVSRGKPKLNLIPYASLCAIARAREYGVNKYHDDECWRQVEPIEFIAAAQRHLFKYTSRESFDDESGLCHLDHAIASLALAISVIDDRSQSFTADVGGSLEEWNTFLLDNVEERVEG